MGLEANVVQAIHADLPGSTLVGSILLSDKRQDLLFAALIMTSFGVWFGGNLLLLSLEVLAYSAPVGLISLGLLFVFYALSRLLKSIQLGILLTCIALVFLVYAKIKFLDIVFNLVILLAFFYTVFHLRVERKYWPSVMLMAVIGGATILGVDGYTYFDILARLQSGMVHQDVLFHSSIAGMIKHYGVVSTGLNGLVEMPYYALSHAMIAGASLAAGVGVLETYGVAPLVLFAPLLIFAVTVVIAMMDRRENLPLPLLWGATAFCLFSFPLLFWRWAVWGSFFVSESYMLSLVIFLLAFCLLFKLKLSMVDLLVIVLSVALIANSKASVGLIFVGLLMVRVVFLRSESIYTDLLTTLLSASIVFWSVIDTVEAVSEFTPIIPLAFIVDYSVWGRYFSGMVEAGLVNEIPTFKVFVLGFLSLISFVVLHFLASWFVTFVNLKHVGVNSLLRMPVKVYSLASIGAGFFIILLFSMPSGGAYYFSNVSFFVSIPFFVAIWVNFFQKKGLDERLLFCVAIFIISMASLGKYYDRSALSSTKEKSSLVTHLLQIREASSPNQVFQRVNTLFDENPIKRCTARPFIFPAVSERAWFDVVQGDGECDFKYYGYSQYGLASGDQRIKVPPLLLPDMFIVSGFFKP